MIDERLLEVIEDHALVTDLIIEIGRCLGKGIDVPCRVPSLHDGLVMDALGNILEALR
jgi:hypothetical protein